MTTYRICGTCKEKKPATTEYFHARYTKTAAQSPDGLQSICMECKSKLNKARYYADPVARAKAVKKNILKARQRNRQFVYAFLETHPCVDCGEARWQVLEFDHVRGTKEYGISKMILHGMTLRRIKKEMDKCEVRCANCHRMKTAETFGYRQTIPEAPEPHKSTKKLTEADVVEIKKMFANGVKGYVIAKHFDVGGSTIGRVKHGTY
jgi:hypothetical protein